MMPIHQKNLYDFSSAEFDLICKNVKNPRKLILCTTPRTSGHFLAKHMYLAGWGVPMEYFWPETAVNLYQRWQNKNCANFGEVMRYASNYGNKLHQYRVNNEIFSVKVFPYNFYHLSQCIDLEDAQYIFLERKDRLSQLISILATHLTGRPFDSKISYKSIHSVQTLDTEIIKKTYYFLRNNYLTWEKFLNRINADNVIKITAEQFISSPYDTINTISTKFQLDIEPTYHADCLTFEKRYTQDSDIKEKIIDEYGEFIRDLIANDF